MGCNSDGIILAAECRSARTRFVKIRREGWALKCWITVTKEREEGGRIMGKAVREVVFGKMSNSVTLWLGKADDCKGSRGEAAMAMEGCGMEVQRRRYCNTWIIRNIGMTLTCVGVMEYAA